MNIKDIVKNNTVQFHYYRQGHMYYTVVVDEAHYIFPVPLEDIGDAALMRVDKAIYYMRYIRKALEDGTFLHHQDCNMN